MYFYFMLWLLLCRYFSVSQSPICQFLLFPEQLESSAGSYHQCLTLKSSCYLPAKTPKSHHSPDISMLFVLYSCFWSYTDNSFFSSFYFVVIFLFCKFYCPSQFHFSCPLYVCVNGSTALVFVFSSS